MFISFLYHFRIISGQLHVHYEAKNRNKAFKNGPGPLRLLFWSFFEDCWNKQKRTNLKNYKINKTTNTKPGNAGFTNQERERFNNILEADFIDSFRYLHPEKIKYTWWSYMFHARSKNVGWRIDYFCISKSLKDNLKDAYILNEVMGSDHCPIGVVIEVWIYPTTEISNNSTNKYFIKFLIECKDFPQ